MKYRAFGRLNWKASVLGFGAMRLPTINWDASKINEPEATALIRYAINHGVNYIDTAYPYHGGNSETVVGKALKDGYREKVKVATKMPTWLVKSQQDMDKYLNEQLDRLKAGTIDFYLLHGLNRERWQALTELEVLGWAEKKVDEGKIRHLGFSFHDEYPTFKEIIDGYSDWTLCQIQYNYMDDEYQAGTKGLKYAASKGLAVVVMEPIAGGRLGISPPQQIQAIWDEADCKRTPAEWALQWVWNHPEVSVTLSGMSSMQQVIENVDSASRSGAGLLTAKELNIIDRAKQKHRELGSVGCTGCRYCMPCSEGVDIPVIISLYNEYFVKDRNDEVKNKYKKGVANENQAKRCAKCGKCEELCPQHLPIRVILGKANMIFEQDS